MSILTIAWSMCAAVCGLMALLQLSVWFMQRRAVSLLLAVSMGSAAAANAGIELAQMFAVSPVTYGKLLVWQNLAIFVIIVSIVWFVRVRYRAGRLSLAILITGAWTVALVANFLSPFSVTFEHIDELKTNLTFWGEEFSLPVGTVHSLKWLADVASALAVVFILDTAIQLWRHGQRRRAALLWSMFAFIVLGFVNATLVDSGKLDMPYMISFAFLMIVLVFAYDLVSDAVQAATNASKVEAEQRRWQSLLDTIHLAVLSIDRHGNIRYVNPCLVQLSGYSETELLNQPSTILWPDTPVEELIRQAGPAVHTEHRHTTEREITCRDGEIRRFEWSAVALRDATESVSGVVEVGADVTERLRAEEELYNARRQMERLTRANVLGELATGIAHELNQPLTAILANAQAACRFLDRVPPDTGEVRDILDDIVSEGRRAGEVIHGLRRMLRIGDRERTTVMVNDTIEDVLKLAKGELAFRSVDIDLDLDEALPLVLVGRIELQQVVMNVVWNAIQAMHGMDQPEPCITIRSRTHGEWVTVDIQDNGPGVSDDDFDRIFESFFSTKRFGMGLGLGICQRIMRAEGGSIRVCNVQPSGACFTLHLPAHFEAEATPG